MTVIIKDGKLTEEKRKQCCKYSGLFKVMNKLSNLIEDIQAVDKYISPTDEDTIRNDTVKQLEQIIDETQERIIYAKKRAEQEKPYWETGELDRIIDISRIQEIKENK